MKTVYICEGECKGVASEEQHKAGAKNCAAKTCNLFNKPLQKRSQCEKCGTHFMPADKHTCDGMDCC